MGIYVIDTLRRYTRTFDGPSHGHRLLVGIGCRFAWLSVGTPIFGFVT